MRCLGESRRTIPTIRTALVELTVALSNGLIDLYAAELAGWRLTKCTLPGLRRANVRPVPGWTATSTFRGAQLVRLGAGALTAVGWLLLSTGAAGATRILTRRQLASAVSPSTRCRIESIPRMARLPVLLALLGLVAGCSIGGQGTPINAGVPTQVTGSSTTPGTRVVPIAADLGDVYVTGEGGLNLNPSGPHSGCRPTLGPDGYLYVGTGDSARPAVSQDRTQLGPGIPAASPTAGDPEERIHARTPSEHLVAVRRRAMCGRRSLLPGLDPRADLLSRRGIMTTFRSEGW